MKYFISIATIEHYDSVEHSIYELSTENEHELFDNLSEKISNSNSTPNMIHRAQEVLKSLKEQEILSYNSYKETSKDYNIDSTAEFETIIEKIIIEYHIKFERIHPFSDGNGRTGRLIMLALMLENNLTPFVITVENRAKYMDILRNQDIENFVSLVKPLIEEEKKRIIAFKKSASLQI